MTDQHLTDQDYELLTAYLDGMLDEADRAGLEARLRIEPLLRRELNALRQTVAAVRALPPLKAPRSFALTPDMIGQPPARVIPFPTQTPEDASRHGQSARRPVSRRLGLLTGLSAAAAAVVMLIGVGLLVTGLNSGVESDATTHEAIALRADDPPGADVPLQSIAITSNFDMQSNALPSGGALEQAPVAMMQGGGLGAEGQDQGIPGEIDPIGLGGGGEGAGPAFMGTPTPAGAVELDAIPAPQATGRTTMPTPTFGAMAAMDEAEEAAGIITESEDGMVAGGAQEAAVEIEATDFLLHQEATPDAGVSVFIVPAQPETMDDASQFSAEIVGTGITQAMIADGTRQDAAVPSAGALRLPEEDAGGTIPTRTLGIGLIAAGMLLAITALILGRVSRGSGRRG
jgi:hypothetical protein